MNMLTCILNLLRRQPPAPALPSPMPEPPQPLTDWDLVLPVAWPSVADGWRTVVVPTPLVPVYLAVLRAVWREIAEYMAERN